MTQTPGAPATRLRILVVQRPGENPHQAILTVHIRLNLSPLLLALLGQALDAFVIQAIGHRRSPPARAVLEHRRRVFNAQKFQNVLDLLAASEVDH